MTTILWALGAIIVLALLLVLKVRRDAITQGGKSVGSALGWTPGPGGVGAHFVIIRGEPAFQEAQPFEYKGQTFVMESHETYDGRSNVLRRFLGATCRMLPPSRR